MCRVGMYWNVEDLKEHNKKKHLESNLEEIKIPEKVVVSKSD